MKTYERIKEIRKSKGISQIFVAEKAEMTIQSYNMKENGKRTISVDDLERIAIALNEPIENFFAKEFHVKLNDKKINSA